MIKKLMILFLTVFLLSLIVGCTDEDPGITEENTGNNGPSEQAYITYEDDYITFQHPAEWLVSGSGSPGISLVIIEKGSGYDFVLEAETVNSLDEQKDFDAQIAEEFTQGLASAEKEDYITKISFEDVLIDGYAGKSLQLEIALLQGTAEVLYGVLSEDLTQHDEIQDYLSAQDDPKSFTEEITHNEEFQEGLYELLGNLEDANEDPEQSLSIARAHLENLQVYLMEDTPIQQRQKISIVAKENLVFRVYFFSDPEQYEDMIDQVTSIMDTIEFAD